MARLRERELLEKKFRNKRPGDGKKKGRNQFNRSEPKKGEVWQEKEGKKVNCPTSRRKKEKNRENRKEWEKDHRHK